MKIKQKILNIEETSYSSNLSPDIIKDKVKTLFDDKSAGVSGTVISENEFDAHENLNIVLWNMPNLKRKSAYLKGNISKVDNGSKITLKSMPNTNVMGFAFLAIITGIVLLVASLVLNYDTIFVILGIFFLLVGIIYYPINSALRNRLREKVVKYLDLQK